MNPQIHLYGEDQYTHLSPGLIYIETSCPGQGVDIEEFSYRPEGCKCRSTCYFPSCECLKFSKIESLDKNVGYLERKYPIFECNSNCECVRVCDNRLTQLGPLKGLKIVPVKGKGLGIVTTREIREGAFVCEYAGEIIGIDEAKNRLQCQSEKDPNYILILREHGYKGGEKCVETTVIDPTTIGNIGRYINHSCEPNLKIVPVRSESFTPVAALFALKHIKAEEELCYDYNESSSSQTSSHGKEGEIVFHSSKRCFCLATTCRSFLPNNQCL